MSVYVSTAAPRAPRGLWELLDAFAAEGVSGVELGFCELEPGAVDLVGKLRAWGFRLLVHNYFPPDAGDLVLNLASPDERIAKASLEFVLRSLELTASLGAPLYSMHAGFVTDPVDFDGTSYILPLPDGDVEVRKSAERYASALDVVVARAEQLGSHVLVENSVCTADLRGKLLLLTAHDLRELFDAFANRPLGLLLDTGHLNVTATTLGFDRDEFVDAVADRIMAFHLHDNDGVVDEHRPPAVGSWPLERVLEPRFAGVPIVIEARFDTPREAGAYARQLEAQLHEQAEVRRP